MKFKVLTASILFTILAFANVKAQGVDDIINKYITAKGGADKINAISSTLMKGNLNVSGMKIPLVLTVVQDKGMRAEFSVNGMTGYQIITATDGWGYNPFQGQTKAEPMTADDVKSSQDALDAKDDLLDYAKKETSVESLGVEDVEGTECNKLKLTFKSGKEKTYYISTADNMLVKIDEKSTVNGKEQASSTMLANYKMVNDVMFAFSINGPNGLIEIETIEVNTPIDEAIFKPSN